MSNGFTYYGDLLGIEAAYQLGADVAYNKLNVFYNTVFGVLEPLCNGRVGDVRVQMFSDSLVVWGVDPKEILKPLQDVYLKLISKGLLLRGAIVNEALEKEPRIEARKFRKFLPANNTLARAVGLERTVKGARLLIEPILAEKLLRDVQEWRTLEGYILQPHTEVPQNSMLRRICPTPSGIHYELLYFWERITSVDNARLANQLDELVGFYDASLRRHLRETRNVQKRSMKREAQTQRIFEAA